MRIVDFEPQFAAAFKALNEAWITHHYALEAKDHEILGDPQAEVIDRGGAIFIAVEDDAVIGCCALKPMADGGFQLAKMTTAEAARGRGVGRALMAACIERARARGAPRIYLESGTRLGPALALYRAFGFVDVEPPDHAATPFSRVDVWMELSL